MNWRKVTKSFLIDLAEFGEHKFGIVINYSYIKDMERLLYRVGQAIGLFFVLLICVAYLALLGLPIIVSACTGNWWFLALYFAWWFPCIVGFMVAYGLLNVVFELM